MQIEALISNIAPRLSELEKEMSEPDVTQDMNRMKNLAREYHRLQELLKLDEQVKRIRAEIEDMREAVEDPELSELAEAELPVMEEKQLRLESEMHSLLIPENPEDSRNAVMEIRAGTGGEEAALFASDLYKMYLRYFELCGWSYKVVTGHFSDLGGIKEIIASVNGDGTYGKLKYESGVHRVQRVPLTETSGRLHTSAATVAVLPDAEEIDVQIDPGDLKIDTFRSSGPGGQHVNKTDSAIRITHLPTGIVVSCQDEKSQLKNKNQAMKVLRARLFRRALDEQQSKRATQRRTQVSSGDRSAKIRTYNFPQNRITDHRVPITVFRLDEVLNGRLELVLEPLIDHFTKERLAELVNEKL